MNASKSIALAAIVLGSALMGCDTSTQTSPDSQDAAAQTSQSDDAHHHHHHEEHLGPNGGHLVELTPADYKVEWLHEDESNLITAIILDEEGKEEVAIPAASISIETVIDETTITYPLDAVDPSEEDPPSASHFEITNETLLTSLKVGTGVDAHVTFTVGDTDYKGEIEHHDHSHGHSHDH